MVHQEQSPDAVKQRSTGYWIGVLLVLTLLSEETAYAYNLVTPALPHMAAALQTADIVWVSTLFSLVGGVTAPLVGKLGDIYGKKRVLLATIAVMAVGSLTVAFAQSLAVVLIGRAMEGVAISIVPLAYSIMRDIFPRRLVAIGVSVVTSGIGLTGILAPIIAGFLIDNFSYRGVFYFLAAFPVVLGILVMLVVPESPVRVRSGIDWGGALLLGASIGLLLTGVSQGATWGWGSGATLACLFGGAVVFGAWVAFEKRARFPLVDVALARRRPLMTTMVAQFAAQGVIALQFVLLAYVVQVPRSVGGDYGLGQDASGLAWFTSPGAVISMLMGFAVGFIANRRGARNPLVFAFVFGIAGCLLLAFMHSLSWQVLLGWFVFAIGGGMLNAAVPNLVVTAVPPEHQAVSAGTVGVVGSLGAAVVVQLVFVILASSVLTVVEGSPIYSSTAFTWAYAFGALICLAGLIAAIAMRHGRQAMAETVEQAPAVSAH
ncbi:MFS transporter [Amycolatopsis thermoflava]|uniref:MFS transporter n=1 Tax=Amycolatopsis thermoflava TaxID=84480 RepID=UPI000410E14E|nr:MFS transporter [Amycolatopsis thermoflava]